MTKPDTADDVKNSIENLQHLATCSCDIAYTSRGLHDPQCLCDYALEVSIVADAIDDLRQAVRHANDHADSAIDELQTALNALDGLLIALSTGKGIAEATDAAKAAMRRATQGDAQ